MTTVEQAMAELDAIAPVSNAAAWDPVGLQVGDPAAPFRRGAVCHDVTAAVATATIEADVDLLVAYHPLVFEPVRRFVAGASPAGVAFGLARRGVALAVVHTAFDAAPGGSADALAEALDLSTPRTFGPLWPAGSVKVVTFVPPDAADAVADAMAAAGAGEVGEYTRCSFRAPGTGSFVPGPGSDPTAGSIGRLAAEDEVRLEMVAPGNRVDEVVAALAAIHPYEEPAYDVYERRGESGFVGRIGGVAGLLADLRQVVSERLGGVVRLAGDPARPAGEVAVVPGSGASLVDAAARAGARVLVTGDVGHHAARAALARGMAIVDPGHAATERPGVARLYAALSARWDDVLDLTGVDADPWTG